MSTIMKIPTRFNFVVVGDSEYKPDAEGKVKVDEPDHIEALKLMGGVVINERVLAPVKVEKTVEKPVEKVAEQEVHPSPVEPQPILSEDLSVEKLYPNDNWKRAEILAWLTEQKVAVDPNITKVAALKIVAGIKDKG